MLKRRNAVLAFLLVAVMLLGVGFAALSETLTVTGTAAVQVASDVPGEQTPAEKEYDEDIYFTNVAAADGTKGVTAELDTTKDAITVTVPTGVLGVQGDTTVITATIKNDSTHAVTVTPVDTDSTNFDVATVFVDPSNENIAAGQSTNVKITITLKTAPTADIAAETIKVTYTVATN